MIVYPEENGRSRAEDERTQSNVSESTTLREPVIQSEMLQRREFPTFLLVTWPSESSDWRRVYAVLRVQPTVSAISEVPAIPPSVWMASMKSESG